MSSLILRPATVPYIPPPPEPTTDVTEGVEDFTLSSTEYPNKSSYIGFLGRVEDFPITVN